MMPSDPGFSAAVSVIPFLWSREARHGLGAVSRRPAASHGRKRRFVSGAVTSRDD